MTALRINGQTDTAICQPGYWPVEVQVLLDGHPLEPQPPVTFHVENRTVAYVTSDVPRRLFAATAGRTRVTARCEAYRVETRIEVVVPEHEAPPIEWF